MTSRGSQCWRKRRLSATQNGLCQDCLAPSGLHSRCLKCRMNRSRIYHQKKAAKSARVSGE